MGRRVLWRHIWGYFVCLCSINRTPGLYGLKKRVATARIDVYEILCPQQMLVHKGGKIKNWGGEFRDVTPTKLQSQNIFKESTGGRVGGGQDGCERRIKVFVKIQKQFFLGGRVGGGGGRVGGVRVDVNREVTFL